MFLANHLLKTRSLKCQKKLKIVRLAIIAGLYVALTWATLPLSYGLIQFRVSEILLLLCFYRKDYIYSLVLGCFIANF